MTTWPMRLVRWYSRLAGRHSGDSGDAAIRGTRRSMDRWMGAMPAARGTLVDTVAGEVTGEWVAAPGASMARTVLYLHGGGYVAGSPRSYRHVTSRLSAASGARVLSLDYRLAPEHPFPAALDDAVAAYHWLLHCCSEPSATVIAGDSAGGGLALAAAVRIREAGDALPAGLVLFAPWADLTGTAASLDELAAIDPLHDRAGFDRASAAYRGDIDPADPWVSPRFADLGGLPPMLIHVGGGDVLLDDARGVAAAASSAGVTVALEVWEGMPHVWHATAPFTGAARRALAEAGAWVARRMS